MTNEEMVAEYQTTHDMNIIYELYEKNMPLIMRILRPYDTPKFHDDLMQEAFLSVWDAAGDYDPERGTLFMSYCQYHIKKRAIRFIKSNNDVHIGSETMALISRYKAFESEYIQEHGRSPTDAEIAEHLGISIKQAGQIRSFSFNGASLDTEIMGENDTSVSLLDAIPDESVNIEDDVVEKVYAEESKVIWDISKEHTSEREYNIIESHYKNNKTLKEISDREQISVERVRQIESRALQKLRQGKAKKKLLEKLYIIENGTHYTGLTAYRNNFNTSYIELEVMKKESIYEELKRRYLDSLKYEKRIKRH